MSTEARFEVPDKEFIPGLGFVGQMQAPPSFSFSWKDHALLEDMIPVSHLAWAIHHISFDVIINNVDGWHKIPAIQRWARLNIPRGATFEVKATINPVCRIFFFEHKIVLAELYGFGRDQVLCVLEEIEAILQDEQLMLLVFQQLLSYQPKLFTSEDAGLISTIIDGNSARKHAEELRRLQARISLKLTK